jgi:peroxiredoxin
VTSRELRGQIASAVAQPPETIEGWYVLHDTYRLPRGAADRARVLAEGSRVISHLNDGIGDCGWSSLVSLVGGPADFLAIHLRERVEDLDNARWQIAHALGDRLERSWSLLGLTEAGLYQLTVELVNKAAAAGVAKGTEQYDAGIARRVQSELENPHLRRRLYPEFPRDLSYVSFYPMSKRRIEGQNWYALPLEERSRLMQAHGRIGRKYAGRVLQIITGSIGLSDWEWGVTLFARDLVDVKKLVTEMRFDEVSAQYAEFGEFYVGKVVAP